MTLKIIKNQYSVPYTMRNIYTGTTVTRNATIGLHIESQGSRHRRKPKPLTSTQFRVARHFVREDSGSITDHINGSVADSIPIAAVIARYCRTNTETSESNGSRRLATVLHKMAGSDFNFGETLVELDQSFNMVNNSIRRLALYFIYAKQGNVKGIRDLIRSSDFKLRGTTPKKRVANAYLEYSFGWAPLANDVYNAFTQTKNILTEKGAKLRRYSGKEIGITSDSWFDTDTTRAGASGVIRNRRLSTVNQLGLANPALMAWNRLPFSFLVDWVVPISSYLGALTWDAGLESTDSWYIWSRKTRQVVSLVQYKQVQSLVSVGDVRSRTEQRIRYPSSSRFVAPDLSSSHFQLSLSKIATSAALLVQINSR